MSSKVNQQPLPFPTTVKPDDVTPAQGNSPLRETERVRPRSKTTPSVSSSSRKPAPLELPKQSSVPLVVLEMEIEDLSALSSVVKDQTTFEITELYSEVKKISEDDNSLPVKQGLDALEEQVRFREYLHARRTAVSEG